MILTLPKFYIASNKYLIITRSRLIRHMNQNDKPNIIYIFCDELRVDALSCYGGKKIQTKNIDRLAKSGLMFDKCYCNSPVCVPSRYSILTSQYPETTGVYHNEAAYHLFKLKRKWKSFPEILKDNGYKTSSFGKTHIPETEVPVFEFENNEGGEMNLGIDIKKEAKGLLSPQGKFRSIIGGIYPEGKYFQPNRVTDNSINWMKNQDSPFLVRISYLQPHTPILVEKKYIDRLKGIDFSGELTEYETSVFEKQFSNICDIRNLSIDEIKMMRSYYHALVLWLDEEVGRILDYLESCGLYENSIIVFNADHGASRGENGSLAKQTFAPQSHRIPLIFRYGDKFHGRVCTDICSGIDIGPTILSMLNIEIPREYQGIDLLNEKNDYVYGTIGFGEKNSFAFPNKQQGIYNDNRHWPRRACIRSERYRLDLNVKIDGKFVSEKDEDIFFCDITKYPNEDVNQVSDFTYTEIISNMYSKLKGHIANSVEVEDTSTLDFCL